MKLKDIFNKKVRDEKKKYKNYNLQDYVITSEFLEFFPDEVIREHIYSSKGSISDFITKENYNTLIELCKINKDFGVEAVKSNYEVSKENLEDLKELNKYGFDFYMCKEYGNELLKYKDKYGDIVMPYLKKNYNLYSKLLKKFNGDIDLKWCLENPSEFYFIHENSSSYEKKLKKIINERKYDNYKNVKKLIEQDYDLYILEMLEYYNFDDEIINLLDSKKIKTEIDILRISSQNMDERNIFDLKCDYEINKCLNENNIERAIVILNEKYFVSRFKEEIEKIFENLKEMEITDFLKEMYNKFKEMNNLKTKEEIISFINQNDGVLDRFKFDFELGKYLNKDLNKVAFNPKDYNYTIKDGVKIIDFDNNDLSTFNMMVHVISDRSKEVSGLNGKFSLILPEHPELWIDRSEVHSDTLSCSMISEYHMKFFGNANKANIILGFSDFDSDSIIMIHPGDAGTNMKGSGKVYDYKTDYASLFNSSTNTFPSKILDGKESINWVNHGCDSYNEIAIGRNTKRPSYILTLTNFPFYENNKPIDETAVKWAKFYDIPIVQLDGKKLYMSAQKRLDEFVSNFENKVITERDFNELLKIRKTIEITSGKATNMYDILVNVIDKNTKINSIESINETLQIIQKYGDLISNDIIIKGNPKIYAENIALYEQRKSVINEKIEILNKMKTSLENNDSYSETSGFKM